MKHTTQMLLAGLSLFGMAASAHAISSWVDNVFVNKTCDYTQRDWGDVQQVDTNPYFFQVDIRGRNLSVSYPSPTPAVATPAGSSNPGGVMTYMNTAGQWRYGKYYFSSQAELDAAFKNGDYIVGVGSVPVTLTLTGNQYPFPPQADFSNGTWGHDGPTEEIFRVDASLPLTISTNQADFSPGEGRVSMWLEGTFSGATPDVQTTTTDNKLTWNIPADTLVNGNTYTLWIDFNHAVDIDTTTISTATCSALYSSRTSLTIKAMSAYWEVYEMGKYGGAGVGEGILWINTGTGDIKMWMMNGTNVASNGAISMTNAWSPKGYWGSGMGPDFNGDGREDLIVNNHRLGTNQIWIMNGTLIADTMTLNSVGPWWIDGVGKFNGDSYSDIVWWNDQDSSVSIWFMNNTTVVGGNTVGAAPGWNLLDSDESADLNGDGVTDLVFENGTTGAVAVWFMSGSGTTVSGGGTIAVPPAGWEIESLARFDGDTCTDILWKNSGTGQVAIWLMNGLSVKSAAGVHNGGDWEMLGNLDTNGDGMNDLIFTHGPSGAIAVWLMNGTTVTDGGTVYNGGGGWMPFNAGDFNGDGCEDVLWTSNWSNVFMWLIDGMTYLGGGMIYEP